MNFNLNQFKKALIEFSKKYAKPSLPEAGYQHILFRELSVLYPDKILPEMEISSSTVLSALKHSQKPLFDKYFRSKKAFNPDLCILNKTLNKTGEKSLNTLSDFKPTTKLAAIIELKATSSAPRTKDSRRYLADTAKLQFLSDYYGKERKYRPATIQVIMNWEGGNNPMFSKDKIIKWYEDNKVRQNYPNVDVLRVGEGECDHLLKS